MMTTIARLAMSTTWSVILFLSANGGVNWAVDASIHWASSVMFDSFNGQPAWVTSGDGIFKSTDVGGAQPDWTFNVNGLEETGVVGAASVPGSPPITALGDVDGFRHYNTWAYGQHWQPYLGTTSGLATAGPRSTT